MQDKTSTFKGPMEALRHIIKAGGLLGLYAGMESTFWRRVNSLTKITVPFNYRTDIYGGTAVISDVSSRSVRCCPRPRSVPPLSTIVMARLLMASIDAPRDPSEQFHLRLGWRLCWHSAEHPVSLPAPCNFGIPSNCSIARFDVRALRLW